MATAMHVRAGRTSSFYLSSYRGGLHSRAWSPEELQYLHCAVDQLSSAMKLSAAEIDDHRSGRGHSIFVNEDGIVILGLQNIQEQLRSVWPEWSGDRLPEHLCNLLNVPGEHVLVDRQLIVTSQSAPGFNDMGLRELPLRNLTKFDLLTQREREVARLLASGRSHKETARLLGVAPATVRNQTQSIYKKLSVRSRAGLVMVVKLCE